jgi:cytochrome c-type biogenesis protein CcmE
MSAKQPHETRYAAAGPRGRTRERQESHAMEEFQPPTSPIAPEPKRGGLAPVVKIGAVVALLGGAVGLLLFGGSASDAFVYSKLVHEVMQNPAEFQGRELRVEGQLKPGSIKFREDPCEWRFVIEKEGKEMPVQFPQCVVPDTFRDGMGISVTVQGKLAQPAPETQPGFIANQVVPRCPSKYEMQQKKKNGEVMPHADVTSKVGI